MAELDKLFPDAVTEGPQRPPQVTIKADFIDWNWLREWLGVPNVQWSTYKSTWKGWHYVAFSAPFKSPPAVVACCSGFAFDILPFPSLPELKLPMVTPLPDLKLPRIQRPDYAATYEQNFRNAFVNAVGDWGIFNWMRDAIAWAIGRVGWACGTLANWQFDVTFKPFLDQVNSTLESFEDAWNTQIVHNFNDLMKSNLEAFTKTWNTEVVGRFYTAISTVQEKLLNFVKGLGITPLGVKDVTTYGCYVYSPENTTVYVIAAGRA